MKTLFLSLMMTLVFGAFVGAQAQTTQQISVRVDNQKSVMRNKLKIKFVSVEDSRCPRGVTCVWAGNAKVTVKLTTSKGKSQTVDLNTGLETKSVKFEGYEVKLEDVSPYPANNIRIDPRGYTAKFVVTKL